MENYTYSLFSRQMTMQTKKKCCQIDRYMHYFGSRTHGDRLYFLFSRQAITILHFKSFRLKTNKHIFYITWWRNMENHNLKFQYCMRPILCIFFTPFITAVITVERLVLQIIYVLNKEILQFLSLKSAVYNWEQFQSKSGL